MYEGVELNARLRHNLGVVAVEGPRGQSRLAVDQLGDLGIDGLRGDDPPGDDRLPLADAVHPVDGLGLLSRGPAQLRQNDVGGGLQVDPHAGRGERGDHDRYLGVGVERADLALAEGSGLVTADGDRLETALGERLLRDIHHVDVLREEHDLAHGAGQLRGVVGREHGLRLADLAHHGEDVVAARRGLRLLEFRVGDRADEAGAFVGRLRYTDGATVPLQQAGAQRGLGLLDAAPEVVVELDREIRDPLGRQVAGDIHLLAPHDPHVDHGLPRLGEEAEVCGGEPVLLEFGHETRRRLLPVDPAEELPDRPEVFDGVDEGGSGEGDHERVRGPLPDAVSQGEHVLGALGVAVLDEVRLVDDHALEAQGTEPADVPVEHVVVDDHHVGEGIEVLSRAVDDRGRALRSPQLHFPGPVHLHDVGHHHQQRIGAGHLRGEERLRGLAEAGLVGQEVGSMAIARTRHEFCLVIE